MENFNAYDPATDSVNIELFTKTEAGLAALREQYGTLPAEVTNDNYDWFKAGAKTLSSTRTAIESARKEIKQPYLDAGRAIDNEAKRITAEIKKIEAPLAALKKGWDDRLKREKEERIARLQKKVDAIKAFTTRAQGMNSEGIAELLESLEAIDTENDFYDLKREAIEAQAAARDRLAVMLDERIQFELAEKAKAKAEAELEKVREAQKITDAISAIRMMPTHFFGKPEQEIRNEIDRLSNLPTSNFADREAEAQAAIDVALQQLSKLAEQAKMMAAAAPQVQEEPEAVEAVEAAEAAEAKPETDHIPRTLGLALNHFCTVKGIDADAQDELTDILVSFGVDLSKAQ